MLRIHAGDRVALVRAPDGFAEILNLPEDVRLLGHARAPVDVVIWFVTRRRELERRILRLAATLEADGALWVAWPAKSSAVCTDLSESDVRNAAHDVGLFDPGVSPVDVCAIDENWTAMRFQGRSAERIAANPTYLADTPAH